MWGFSKETLKVEDCETMLSKSLEKIITNYYSTPSKLSMKTIILDMNWIFIHDMWLFFLEGY